MFNDIVICIAAYTLVIGITYYAAGKSYAGREFTTLKCRRRKSDAISVAVVFLIALLFTLFNVLISWQGANSDRYDGDRMNYYNDFIGVKEPSQSPGLLFIIRIIHIFSDKTTIFFFGTTFVCALLTLFAYRKCKEALPLALLFLVLTQWFFGTYDNLKQCYCSAFASLFFVYALKKPKFSNRIKSVVCILFACLFHVSGYLLIPVYFMLCLQRRKKKIVGLIFFFVVAVFFKPLILIIGRVSAPIAPSLAEKITQYFMSSETIDGGSAVAFLKGFPFYYISYVGLKRQRIYKQHIQNYNSYMLISLVTSLCYLLSVYSYWLYRLTFLFYLPVGVLFAQMMKVNNKKKKRMDFVFVLGVLAVLIYRYMIIYFLNYGGFSGFYV